MTQSKRPKKLTFEKAMEINGISPLPHYYEEIYTNQIGLPSIGIRGDKNYLFYSRNGLGAGYYEETEKQLSADSVYDYFQKPDHEDIFFNGINNVISELKTKTNEIDNLDLDKLGVKNLAQLFLEANELHGKVFSYYVVSQPYRMKRFEDQVVSELKKRVATSRIDSYMTMLGTSNEATMITEEEFAWLNFIIKYKTKYPSISSNPKQLKVDHPDMHAGLIKHFEKYKILTLGDGNWNYDLKFFLQNLVADYKKDIGSLKKKLKSITNHSRDVEEKRKRLIADLYLDRQTIENLDFLAKMGHSRLTMRIEGWIPFVMTIIKLDIALSKQLGQRYDTDALLNFMEPEEIKRLAKTGIVINAEILIERMGIKKEFLILHDDGIYRIFYGDKASRQFKKLVAPIDHENTSELTGSTAVRGRITGTVCVYKWGDNLEEKQKIIQKHPILVAGQTRPAMMPIIRLAKGIITDEGGVTSHAAIVSRELGIPSIIGTTHATQVFKDGDLVELDADHGVVRKLS